MLRKRSGVAEQFNARVNRAVLVAIENEETVARADPAGMRAAATAVEIEVGTRIVRTGGVDAVAVNVEDQRVDHAGTKDEKLEIIANSEGKLEYVKILDYVRKPSSVLRVSHETGAAGSHQNDTRLRAERPPANEAADVARGSSKVRSRSGSEAHTLVATLHPARSVDSDRPAREPLRKESMQDCHETAERQRQSAPPVVEGDLKTEGGKKR